LRTRAALAMMRAHETRAFRARAEPVTPGSFTLSASELSGFSECAHHTHLNLAAARGELPRPGENEIERLLLERRGVAHEAQILAGYKERGLEVRELSPAPVRDAAGRARAARETEEAMRAGADVLYQATLVAGRWSGRPDFLIKVPGASALGAYHYEVVDAKLARHAQARALIQLAVYTEQLAALQARLPEHFWIAIGGSSANAEPIRLRSADYLSYHRLVRARFERFIESGGGGPPYPEPVEYCDVCRWWKQCEARRRGDDHPSLVAGITRRQRDRLALAGVTTARGLATLAPDVRVAGIDPGPLARVREQARLQLEMRDTGRPRYELLLDAEPGTGLERLPPPTPGDLFLDLEGDAFAFGTGLEYLFGWVELGEPSDGWSRRDKPGAPRYQAHWAGTPSEEKAAFVALMDRIRKGRNEFPELHVYHFGHREADALKKLSCRHGTKEDEVDDLFRKHVLVDLHAVVRQGLRASVEGYTLKQLECLYGFQRQADRRAAAEAMQLYGFWLETGDASLPVAEYRPRIERYNEEDCRSCHLMRDWLEQRRDEYAALTNEKLARPAPDPAAEKQAKSERNTEAAAVVEDLRKGLPELESQDTPVERARRLLSHLVGWHWREQKSAWWEYYRAKELAPIERLEDRAVLHGLVYEGIVKQVAKSHVHRYRFPEQEHSLRSNRDAEDPDTGKSVKIFELGGSTIDLKRGKSWKGTHPTSLIASGPIETKVQEQTLLAVAKAIAWRGIALDDAEFASARALLLREPPRAGQAAGAPLLVSGEDPVAGIVRIARGLSRGVLAVQGPPGSGKTHAAAETILALVRAGRRVGVTANSHQVIINLLERALTLAERSGQKIGAHHLREDDSDDESPILPPFSVGKDHAAVLERLQQRDLVLVGGTSFAWSRSEYRNSVDVLIVDEAAQVSLANVIAASAAASALILFGDPAQLEQPQRGVHPPGAAVSALEHLIGEEARTMPPELGIFLPTTRRLHPSVCQFTSEVFYEGRLTPLGDLSRQGVCDAAPFPEHGLCFVPVAHRGNTNRSDEEVDAVVRVVERLLRPGVRYRPLVGDERAFGARDILVVAPYNAQVSALRRALPEAVRVGTVDKFQGQEAPVVIYSLTTSTAADAPRGLEFLYSLNRLNVATSRAQALVILVASSELSLAHCRTPRQMQLVNALCAYLERAKEVSVRD
jgi:predicted RecB family nuclease